MKCRSPILITLLAGLVLACGDDENGHGTDGGADASATPPTPSPTSEGGYYDMVRPILEARCVACHIDGGPAPFALETYEQVRAMAGLVRGALLSRHMPPMHADDRDCRPLSDTRKMLDSERQALVAWLDADMPEGDADAEPIEPPVLTSEHDEPLGEPTSQADFGLSYESTSTELDDYRCLIVDPGWTGPRNLRGIGVRPGNPAIVHHAIVFAQLPAQAQAVDELDAAEQGPGYTCFGGAGFTGGFALGGFVPGAPTRGLPGGATVTLPAGTRFIVQMHYNFLATRGADNTELAFYEVDAPSVIRTSGVVLINRGFTIPADDPEYTVTGESPIREGAAGPMTALGALSGMPGLAWGVGAHMHTRGKSIRVDLLRGGEEQCLLDIPAWDFHWQGQYRFMEPLELVDGDRLRITCTWDNSAANQPVVDGMQLAPADITWGESTLDEMCLGSVQMTR
jgi:hypothetical protein